MNAGHVDHHYVNVVRVGDGVRNHKQIVQWIVKSGLLFFLCRATSFFIRLLVSGMWRAQTGSKSGLQISGNSALISWALARGTAFRASGPVNRLSDQAPFEHHDFMAIEQDMEIFNRLDILGDINAIQIDQLDRGQQNFGTVKHPLRDGRADKDAVLARHQKILRGQALAQGTGTDAHGPQLWVGGKVDGIALRAADPADLLGARVHGQNVIAGSQILDPDLSSRGFDLRAAGKADNGKIDCLEILETDAADRARFIARGDLEFPFCKGSIANAVDDIVIFQRFVRAEGDCGSVKWCKSARCLAIFRVGIDTSDLVGGETNSGGWG